MALITGQVGGIASCPVDQVPTPAYRADWYPDPTGRFEFRYFNGQAWTGDVSVDGNRFLDPLVVPGTGQVSFAHVPFAQPKGSGTGRARAAFVLGLCSFLVGWVPFLCFIAIGAAIVGLVLGIGVLRREAHDRAVATTGAGGAPATTPHPAGHGYAVGGLVMAPLGLAISVLGVWLSVLAIREVNDFANVGAHHNDQSACAVVDGVASYSGTITNDSSTARGYNVTIEFERKGTTSRVAIGSDSVATVQPGETANVEVAEQTIADDVDCRIFSVTGPLPFGQS
ncbi:MAG: hypothetical protein JWL72_578 [Ilumatobacteraceae bacterium]|nr:hypothetical protein [Ilumatobacteraceae bacterium]